MIAVTFALPTESSSFTKLLKARAIDEGAVCVVHTGVGEAAATRSIRQFLATHSPALLISSGFAGALTLELAVADLLLARNFTSPEWVERARLAAGKHARAGILATASAITDTPDERAQLAARAGAVAVDMETQFIADACAAASVPMIALRVISDTPALPMPAPPHVLFDVGAQKTSPTALLRHIARRPASILRLVAFARRISNARERLAIALANVVQEVSAQR